MNLSRLLLLLFITLMTLPLFGQDWPAMMSDPKANFYDVQKAFEAYWEGKDTKQKGKGWKPYKRWEWFTEQRVYPSGDRSQMNKAMSNFAEELRSNPDRGFQSGPSDWTFMGPSVVPERGGAGRCNFIRFDPNNTNILWTGSPGGGLWKSEDAGESWINWNLDYLPVIGCTDIAIVPSNTNIMYLATGDGYGSDTYSIGVLKSTDGGVSWNPTGLAWDVTATHIIRRLLLHPENSDILLAGTSDGIYRSTNAGDSWVKVQGGNIYDIEFKPGDPTIVYAGSNRFLRSIDGGISWSQASTGIASPAEVRRFSIAVTPANAEYVYVLAAESNSNGYKGLYRSTDSGVSFSQQSNSPNLLGWQSDGSDSGGQGWYTLSVAASPTNPDAVTVGGVNIWRSSTGGSTWGLDAHWWGDNAPYVHADIHDMAYLPGSGITYYAATDGGIFRTTNNGFSWEDLSEGLEIAQLYRLANSATEQNLILSGWQDNGTNRLSDNSWERVIGGDGMECIVDHQDADIMYGALYYGNIRRSFNGGEDFDTVVDSDGEGVNSEGLWVTPYIMHPTNSPTLLVGKDELYRSTDYGNNWEQLGSIGGAGLIRAIAYAPSNPDVIYAARSNTLHVSTDGGLSFSNISTGLPSLVITYITVSSTNPDRVYVTYSGYMNDTKVYVSNSRGSIWTNYSTGLPNLPVNCIEFQNGSNNGVYVGTDVGVYYRDGSMSSWTPFNTNLPNVVVNELEIHYNSSRIRAATYGRGIWESPLFSGEPTTPVAAFSFSPATSCAGSTVFFSNQSQNNPLQVSWTFEGGSPSISTNYNPEVTWLTPGTYSITLTVTNTAGTSSEIKTIEIKPVPVVEISPANPSICAGESIVLTASGANSFFWTNNLGGGVSKTVSPSATTSYTITGNIAGCTSKTTVTVEVNALPLITIIPSADTICAGDQIELIAQGAVVYEWGEGLGTSEVLILQPSETKTYHVVGESIHGCMDSTQIEIVAKPLPDLLVEPANVALCAGEVVTLTASGAISYFWSDNLGTQEQVSIQPGSNTTIQLTGTSDEGCSRTLDIPVIVHALPVLTLNGAEAPICAGESAEISVIGAETYSWSDGLGVDPLIYVTPSETTTYSVIGLSTEGCSAFASITLSVNPLPVIDLTSSPFAICAGESALLSASGAVSYFWNDGLGSDPEVLVAPLNTTSYSLTGTSLEGCTASQSVQVVVHPKPQLVITPPAPLVCSGDQINLTASGASSYSWSNGLGELEDISLQPSETASYTVTGTTAEGCMDSLSVEVNVHVIEAQIRPWPDNNCTTGLYQLATTAEVQGYVIPDGWLVDTTQGPYFFQVLSSSSDSDVQFILSDNLATCIVKFDLNHNPNLEQVVSLGYDHCTQKVTMADACPLGSGTWYRLNRISGALEVLALNAPPLLEGISIADRTNYGFIYQCGDPCGTVGILARDQEGGFPPCMEPGTFKLVLSPNPASAAFSIDIHHFYPSDLTIRIWDVSGRLIDEQKMDHPGGITTLPITTTFWAAGAYVVSVKDNAGKEVHQQLIVH